MSLTTTALVGMLLLADPNPSTAENAPVSRYVLLEFTASWCGPCQQMSPMIHRLQRKGYPIRQIDVDQHREFASRCKVTSMPTFVMVADKKEVTRFVGACSEEKLVDLFQQMESQYPPLENETILVENDASTADSLAVAKSTSSAPRKSIFRLPFSIKGGDSPRVDVSQATIRANNALPGSDDEITPLKETSAVEPAIDPLAASVRLRVKDAKEVNLGSGTIIHSVPGRTLILTCGHIFRHLDENSRIEVDVFVDGQTESYIGTLIKHDLEADVGVLSIQTETPIDAAMLQSLEEKVNVGEKVFSIGCGGGDEPTVQKLAVTALNRYLGPDNVECTGVPVQGRSGGGLFNAEGEVIGVCFAADSKEGRGLYAGLKPIYELLAKAELIESTVGIQTTDERRSIAENELAEEEFTGERPDTVPLADLGREPSDLAADVSRASVVGSVDEADLAEAAGLDSLEGAEVVCIIRPVKESRAASRVVIIHRASPKFINYLTEEVSLQPKPTSVRIPNERLEQPPHFSGPKFIVPESATATQPSSKYRRYQRSER